MTALREALAKIVSGIGLNHPLLQRARRRYKANRKRAYVAHAKAVKTQKRADRLRGEGHLVAADAEARKADRLNHRAYKNHQRAQWWLGRIKVLHQRLVGLEQRQAELAAELKKLQGTVTIEGDHASGGTPRERLKAVALASAAACASGRRANFYSQAGAFDAKHCITGPAYGHRDDCSSWFASVYYSAGLADPSGEDFDAGWTGTLVQHGQQVTHPEPGDAVIYGPGAGHHVEMYVGPGDRTIGHGSAPVDAGVIDLFGDGDYRFFRYV